MVLVCHVISQDHLIKGSCDFIGGSSPPPSLPHTVGHHTTTLGGILVVEICFLWLKDKIPHALA